MDWDNFPADLFPRPKPDTLRLVHPQPALLAILRNQRTIRCDGMSILDDNPVQALIGALAASQRSDSAVQVQTHRGEAVMFVESFRKSARVGSMPA